MVVEAAAADRYEPSKYGRELHALKVDWALAGGAAGPGKSLILLMDANEQILVEHERCRRGEVRWGNSTGWALHLRREFPMLDQTIARSHRYFKSIDPAAHYDSQTYTWHFSSGYRYQFGHCKDTADYEKYRSGEYTHIAFDELTQFEEIQFLEIAARCRSSDPVLSKMLKVRAATNPAPGWVRDMFVDPAPQGRVVLSRWVTHRDGTRSKTTRMFLPATLYDNPNPDFVRQYEARLLTLPTHIKQALLHGDWYVVAGAFFAEDYIPSLHVVRPFLIPQGWTRFRSMDWGYKSHGCVLWWAVTPHGGLVVEREYTFRRKTAHEVAMRIREIERDAGLWNEIHDRSRITGPADTQLWEKRGESAPSKAEEMEFAGVSWAPANKSSRSANAQRVITRLKERLGPSEEPGLQFFEGAVMCRRTLPAIQADPDNPEEPLKSDHDHWYDAIAYGVAYRAPKSDARFELKRKHDEDEFEDERQSDRRHAPRGSWGYGAA